MPETIGQVGATLTSLTFTLASLSIHYGVQVLAALLILFVAVRAARYAGNALDSWLNKRAVDVSLRNLVVRVLRVVIVTAGAIVAAEKAGVPVTSVIAGIGVAGLGAGLALQGVLGNVFAGLTILFTRPFRVGEYIEILGVHGQVTEITLFSTTLLSNDRSSVVVPNRKIVGEILHNHGTRRRMELKLGVDYSTDLERALAIVRATLSADARVLPEPTPLVGVRELSDSAIILAAMPWVGVGDFEHTRVDLNRALVEALQANGIHMPCPQREIRLIGGSVSPA